MHIEPGVVDGTKIALSYATATGAAGYGALQARSMIQRSGIRALTARAAVATAAAFTFFQILPHYPVGVSEVHFILGSTLFLLLGAAPAAIGLGLALLLQGLFFAQFDLPQYGMNLTTLLVPLFGLSALANKIIARDTAYVDLSYGQVLKLSLAFQGGVVAWVAFWAIYGQGVTASNLSAVTGFGAAYMLVVLIEPIVDLLVLGGAKTLAGMNRKGFFEPRLYNAG